MPYRAFYHSRLNVYVCDIWQNYVIPCDSPFDLVFQFGGQNFTINKEDVLVPSTAAIDSYNYGGYASTNCQAQIQPFTPTGNEVGPETSQTHHLGDVFFRNVISGKSPLITKDNVRRACRSSNGILW